MTSHKQTTNDEEYETGCAYNLGGALIEETYPSGRVVKNILDPNGDLAVVKSRKNANAGFWNYADSFTYNAAGAVTSMQLGNGRWESTTFNSRLQPTQIGLGVTQGATNLLDLDYTYGTTQNNGNVLSQTITVPTVGQSTGFVAVQTYSYDSLNRLKDATENLTPNGGSQTQSWKQTFTFDRYGNRRFDFANGNTTMPLSSCTEAICNPTISTSNNRLTSTGWSYDSSGNTIADPEGRSFIYDGENKQVKVLDSQQAAIGEYSYDGDGKRVKKYVPDTGEYTIFVYDAGGKLVAEYSTQVASSQDAKVAYLTNDHLGSPRINTDANGTVTARHDYHPFGEEIATSQRITGLGYANDSVRKQFTGYERDDESELDFAQARYFSHSIGRFSTPDPVAGRRIDPQTLNRYVYVMNNPLNYVDPSGYCGTTAGSPDKTPCRWYTDGNGNYMSVSEQQFQNGSFSGWNLVKDRESVYFTLSGLSEDYADDDEYKSFVANKQTVGLGSNGRFVAIDDPVQIVGEEDVSDETTQVTPGSGYLDFNVTAAYHLGVTGGVMVDAEWNPFLYLGGTLTTTRGISGSVNYSPDTVTPGWNAQLQVNPGIAAPGLAVGIDRKKNSFTEIGVGPLGASASLFWVFGDDDGSVPPPPPGPNAAVNSPRDYNRPQTPNCSCNVSIPR